MQNFRHQELLLRSVPRQQLLHPFVHDSLVRGVHVHQHHAVGRLRQDIDAVKLCDRITQGRGSAVSGTAIQRALRRHRIAHCRCRGAQIRTIGIGGAALRRFRQREARLHGSSREGCGTGEPVRGRAAGGVRRRPGIRQHFFQSSKYEVMDAARIAKSNFQLLRMRVDIDLARIHS